MLVEHSHYTTDERKLIYLVRRCFEISEAHERLRREGMGSCKGIVLYRPLHPLKAFHKIERTHEVVDTHLRQAWFTREGMQQNALKYIVLDSHQEGVLFGFYEVRGSVSNRWEQALYDHYQARGRYPTHTLVLGARNLGDYSVFEDFIQYGADRLKAL